MYDIKDIEHYWVVDGESIPYKIEQITINGEIWLRCISKYGHVDVHPAMTNSAGDKAFRDLVAKSKVKDEKNDFLQKSA